MARTFPVEWDRRIYLASSATLIDLLREIDGDPAAVLIVGHDPGLEDVIFDLVPDDSLQPAARGGRGSSSRPRPSPCSNSTSTRLERHRRRLRPAGRDDPPARPRPRTRPGAGGLTTSSGISGSTAAARSPMSSRARPTARSSPNCCPRTPAAMTTPRSRRSGVLAGRQGGTLGEVRIGTTVATNALLERKGERARWRSRAGSATRCAIGTQERPDIFARHIVLPAPLYGAVVEIDERVGADGDGRCAPLDEAAARAALGARSRRGLRRARDRADARLALYRRTSAARRTSPARSASPRSRSATASRR